MVYDSSRKRMCRIESDYMKPIDTLITVAGNSFTFPDGIFSTIIDDDKYLLFKV